MAQLVDGGPPISIANFGNSFTRFCESCEEANKLNRFRSYRSVTPNVQVSERFNGTLVRLESEERGDRFRLVADGVCERCNSAVGQAGAESIGGAGGVRM
jgi:hypothetical protein